MYGLDTNILARYYIDDVTDTEAVKQQQIARQLIESGKEIMISKTVLLEFEWVMRGYYGFKAKQIMGVFDHLLSLRQLTLEDRHLVERAIELYSKGFDFADALHHTSYRECGTMLTFDDKKFVRKVKKLGLMPGVRVPK